jgi:hypothetical protein
MLGGRQKGRVVGEPGALTLVPLLPLSTLELIRS